MRGTACSGGAFDYFEPLQNLDGYDIVETVARQPWVLHHKVGMMGLSYGGISQLFVAATDPPDLAAIAPLSVIDSSATTLYPGGILNTGFTLGWAQQRDFDALPAGPNAGEAWAYKRIQEGDQTCKANQVMHGEATNTVKHALASNYLNAALDNPLDPITFVNKIKAPTFLACQLNDEQVGPHCPDLAEHFTGARWKWFTFTNGLHIDSIDPATFVRWYDFMELFVARRAPKLSATVRALAPAIFSEAMGVPGVSLPADPIESEPTYAAALHAFEALPPVRVLFDNGAGSSTPGAPVASFEDSFSRFPIPGTQARSWYLGSDGALASSKSSKSGSNKFTWSKEARPATDFTGPDDGSTGGIWTALPDYNWTQNPAGTALSYLTAPLSANTTVIGAGGVQLWVRASVPDVDLQVTVTEVRPDGNETFVQNGWLRASERKLTPASTLLEPVPTFKRADAAPLPKGRYTELTVPLFYEGHVYRKGSRIRIIISAPGGDQPVWAFARTVPNGKATVSIAWSKSMASRLVLPVVPDVSVPTGLPPCPSLRGEPCRAYQPVVDG
jgi:predicted acyl esterase